jgi:hypothetical protein
MYCEHCTLAPFIPTTTTTTLLNLNTSHNLTHLTTPHPSSTLPSPQKNFASALLKSIKSTGFVT